MTRSLALECGRSKVTVNALSPGLMATAITEAVPAEVGAALLARTAFGRIGTPDVVARGIELLLDADYMTGQVLSVHRRRDVDLVTPGLAVGLPGRGGMAEAPAAMRFRKQASITT